MAVSAQNVGSQASPPVRNNAGAPFRHLIITVHGIRTFGRWQERLESMLRTEVGQTKELSVQAYKYGYFSVFAFLVPFLRWLVTLRFRRALLRATQDGLWDRIDLVGHSFGTHIIAWGLHGIKQELRPDIHTIILSGSVLKSDFPWDDLIGKNVARVVNDCGTRDKILLLSQFAVLFTGMAGRLGFGGMTSSHLRNRFFAVGHSGYFLQNGSANDTFMRTCWLPPLTSDTEVTLMDERQENYFSGPLTFLANNAEPIKLMVYFTPLLIGLWAVYGLYAEAEIQRQSALSRVLAFESIEALNNRELSLRLSLEAFRMRDTLEARRSVVESLSHARGEKFFNKLCCANDSLSALMFSKNDRHLFSGDTKGNLLRWDLTTGLPTPISLRLDGKLLYIGNVDAGKRLILVATRQVSFFNLATMSLDQEPVELPFEEVSTAVLSANGNRLAIGDREGRIAVRDSRSRKWSEPMTDTKLHREVITLAFHPNEELLAASYGVPPVRGREQPIILWNVLTGQRVDLPFLGHQNEVMSLDFSPDGKQLASGSWDQDIRLWDVGTGQTVPPVFVKVAHKAESEEAINAPTFISTSPDGSMLASVMKDAQTLWDIENHKPLARFTGLISATTVAFSREHNLIAVGGKDNNILLIPTDFQYWLDATCREMPRPLSADEKIYYQGDNQDRGTLTEWLWDTYWSIKNILGDTQDQRRMAVDPCGDI